MASNAVLVEAIRQALPELAEPIGPGELVASWLDRAARAAGISAERARRYWHRRVACPKATEYVAVMAAAQKATARKLALQALEQEIESLSDTLRNDHARLVACHPVLARLVPVPPEVGEDATPARSLTMFHWLGREAGE